jgi:hypothetical protein
MLLRRTRCQAYLIRAGYIGFRAADQGRGRTPANFAYAESCHTDTTFLLAVFDSDRFSRRRWTLPRGCTAVKSPRRASSDGDTASIRAAEEVSTRSRHTASSETSGAMWRTFQPHAASCFFQLCNSRSIIRCELEPLAAVSTTGEGVIGARSLHRCFGQCMSGTI